MKNMKNTVEKLLELRNRFEARRETIGNESSELVVMLENKIKEFSERLEETNKEILCYEVQNLLDGVNVINQDHYAPLRIYSKIQGVKNLRFSPSGDILVKVTSPAGCLLPEFIDVAGNRYEINFDESRKYEDKIDY